LKTLIVAASVLLGAATTAAQQLSSEEVASAIAQGRAGKTLQKKCNASGENGFDIVVEGPIGRIMRAAFEAQRHHREFSEVNVTPEVSGPWLSVVARRDPTLTTGTGMPLQPGVYAVTDDGAGHTRAKSTMGYTYATDVALKSKKPGPGGLVLLKPAKPIRYSRESSGDYFVWTDGPQWTGPMPGSDMIAWFDLAAFKAMPSGDVDVVIFTTDAGERRCKITEKDRRVIR